MKSFALALACFTAAVGTAAAQGPNVRIHVIGYDIKPGSVADKQLREVAAAGGGRYFPAADSAALGEALGAATGTWIAAAAGNDAEPNDARSTATETPMNAKIEGRIRPKGDGDWYRLRAWERGELALSVSPAPAGLDVSSRVLDENLTAISGWFSPPGPGKDSAGLVDIPARGIYYLEVRDGYDDATSDDPYVLHLKFTPVIDATREPNGRLSEATFVHPTCLLRTTILPQGDVDLFRIRVDHHGALDLLATGLPPELDAAIRVLDEDFRQIAGWFTPARKGADTSGLADLPRPGDYYIEVRDNYDDARSPQEFTVQLKFTPAADAFEPNPRIVEATPIALDGALKAAILPQGDIDFYRVTAPTQGEWTFTAKDVPPGIDVAMRVHDENRVAISGWFTPARKGGDTAGTVDFPAAGTYFLEARDNYDDARDAASYTIATKWTPTPDGREPNNVFRDAATIAPSGAWTLSLLPKGDVDFFSATVDRHGEWTIDVTGVPPECDIAMRVHDDDLKVVGGWFTSPRLGGDASGVVDLQRPGRYYLEIRENYDDARSPKGISAKTRFAPSPDLFEPNNAPGAATPLASGRATTGAILPRGDGDYYSLTVGAGGKVAVTVSGCPADLDMCFRLLKPDGSAASGWTSASRKGADATGEIPVTDAGPYVLEVRDSYDDARSVLPYTLTVIFR